MTKSSIIFKVGTRSSKLALVQAQAALQRCHDLVPAAEFDLVPFSSPGDRDRQLDLRVSPADFFTRDLDAAVSSHQVDAAIHSAKDVPKAMVPGLDWCWLPERADRRDALVLPVGKTLAQLPTAARFGVSSDRREQYCRQRFPDAQLLSIRGNIEQRLAQLDAGDYDAVIIAGAALQRLGCEERITAWIELDELPSPEAQGALCLCFRADDQRLRWVRRCFVKAVTFVGAGVGSAQMLTQAGAAALQSCDICFYDCLLDSAVLELLPSTAQTVDVGKRCGAHNYDQTQINRFLADACRKGYRVVRLKGGDPGIFGRLSEETDLLQSLDLPYRVIPGISSLATATTATGILLTRRGVSRGFTVLTPRRQGGAVADIGSARRAELPMVFFMALTVAGQVQQQLLADGLAATTPTAIVYAAGMPDQQIVSTTLAGLPAAVAAAVAGDLPGLLIIGEIARYRFDPELGALAGKRVLLTCSAPLLPRAMQAVLDYGGVPVPWPLISLHNEPAADAVLKKISAFDWLLLTSPAAVRCFAEALRRQAIDLRALPKIMVAGPGTAAELRDQLMLAADAVPAADYGADSVIELARQRIAVGSHLLRLRSDKAGPGLATDLRQLGLSVTDTIVYRNLPVAAGVEVPPFEAAVFASASAVDTWFAQSSPTSLATIHVAALGPPTAAALQRHGRAADVIAGVASIEATIAALAGCLVSQRLLQQA